LFQNLHPPPRAKEPFSTLTKEAPVKRQHQPQLITWENITVFSHARERKNKPA
jgi:hypothetical protein